MVKNRFSTIGVRIFFLMCVYIFASKLYLKSYGFLPEYSVVFFFLSFFFLGLGFLPLKLEGRYLSLWLLFISFMLSSIGGGIAFSLAFVGRFPLTNIFVEVGAVAMMLGIFLMVIAILFSFGSKQKQL